MKLIVVTGEPNSGKDYVARKLSENSDVKFIRPYSDRVIPLNEEAFGCSFIPLRDKKLDVKLEQEVPLFVRTIGKNRYVVFNNQLNADYIVLILDVETLEVLRNDYDGELLTIYCTKSSCPNPDNYDVIFNPEYDEIDYLEVKLYE